MSDEPDVLHEAAVCVYDRLFSGVKYQARQPSEQHMADLLNEVFRHSTVERIKAAIKGGARSAGESD